MPHGAYFAFMGKEKTPEKAFAKILKELRKEKGVSQETLAFESDLDRTYISLLERGLRQPTLATILKLSNALEVSPVGVMGMVVKELKI